MELLLFRKNSGYSLLILSKDILVISHSGVCCCNDSFPFYRARLDGIQVKRDLASKDIKTSSGSNE